MATTESESKVYSFTMSFRIFDHDAFQWALEDLENAYVCGEGEGLGDNSIEENLEILVKHLDVLAIYRELDTISFISIGIEQVTV